METTPTPTTAPYTVTADPTSSSTATGTQDYALPQPSNLSLEPSADFPDGIRHVVDQALPTVMLIIGTLAVFYVMYGGILYITAGGDANRVKAARSTVLNVMIGIVVVISTFFIIRFAVGIGKEITSL